MNAAEFLARAFDTNLAIGALIIAVILLRRPVAKAFGAEAALLLWLAPALRAVMPDLAILPPPQTAIAPVADQIAEPINAVLNAPVTADAVIKSASGIHLADFAPIAALLWIAGAFIFLFLQFRAQRRFEAALDHAGRAPSAPLAAEARVIARECGLKRAPRIILSRDAGPLASGFFRPSVYLPEEFETSFTRTERRLALTHEFAHIARGDLAVSFAVLLFRAANWPNPLVHLALRAFRADQEAACDASVIRRCNSVPEISYAYGAALLKAARSGAAAPASTLSMSSLLKERLMLMKSPSKFHPTLSRIAAAMLVTSGLALSANYAYAHEDHSADKTEKVAKKKNSTSITVITVDEDESMTIKGFKDPGKFYYKNENGDRVVRVYDRKGKLLSEDVYGPDDKMPYEEIAFKGKDGKTKVIHFTAAPDHPEILGLDAPLPPLPPGEIADGPGKRVVIIKGDGDHDLPPLPPGDVADGPGKRVIIVRNGDDDGAHRVVIAGDDAEAMLAGSCNEDDGDVDVSEEKGAAGKTVIRKRIICINGAEKGDPKARVEALKKTIARLQEELAKAEKEAAKK